MRQLILIAILAVGAVAASSTASFAQRYTECIHGRGCVPTTQESYNACFNLAMRRGLTVTVGDYRNLNYFIFECLAGRIPR